MAKSKYGSLIKFATVAGPVAIELIRKYGPALKKIAQENPELLDRVKATVGKLRQSKGEATLAGLEERIGVLRDQITYLYASADNPGEARRAKAWRGEVEVIERALPILQAMAGKQRKAEAAKLSKRLDTLSAQILDASIEEQIEDAEIVEES
ncbi:hypothetical protein J2S49_000036 [Arcanobacterium wilhelmae]|uniref:Uncharacterized protein n=1 Tax=Arcanobacterium wilhelmae TaxID=1803177 RepID=A0ABT9N8D2_9ACTO|nr:hypothetical protein [Arcanobacterium wilhelmae]MDP9799960.1 hypothetical protein [Arcanobacterium wilhelmae]WFN91094.1 hypothetical protein P8A24_04395 [Arcanobacterium wilhelmae]